MESHKIVPNISKPPTSNDKGHFTVNHCPRIKDPASGTPSKKVGNSWAWQLCGGTSVWSWRFLTAMKIHKGFPVFGLCSSHRASNFTHFTHFVTRTAPVRIGRALSRPDRWNGQARGTPFYEHMGKYLGKNMLEFTTHIWIFIVYMDIGGPQKCFLRFSPNAGAPRQQDVHQAPRWSWTAHPLPWKGRGIHRDTTKWLVSGGKSHGLWMVYSWKLGFKWMMTGKYPYHSVSFRISGNLHMTCWNFFFVILELWHWATKRI